MKHGSRIFGAKESKLSQSKRSNRTQWELAPDIAQAHRALRAKAQEIGEDPTRPRFHFLPPAGWMNDPNGTIFHNGYYHLFYQHNPYADTWNNLHWGHARSRDLVNWEHLPIALSPSPEYNESSCYSGCCHINGTGTPMIFYTRVQPKPEPTPREQWAAVSDDSLITWSRHPRNPMLAAGAQGGPSIKGKWRDPYVFVTEGRTFLIISAQLAESAGGDFVILLYEASDEGLEDWQFRNIILRKPGYELSFLECPNFVRLGDEWMLITSPYKPVEYHLGTLNLSTYTFAPRVHGRIDAGIDYYATNIATAPDGRTILFAWIRGFRKGRGWNGCLALPRELELGNDGRPITRPVRELEQLRKTPITVADRAVGEDEIVLASGEALDSAELECSFSLGEASNVELRLLRSEDGKSSVSINYDGYFIDVHGTRIDYEASDPEHLLTLHVFVIVRSLSSSSMAECERPPK